MDELSALTPGARALLDAAAERRRRRRREPGDRTGTARNVAFTAPVHLVMQIRRG
ncbi:hypothetical protein [Streptomyces sp. SID3343]|uniref:hypothetical protein n=1 Tax=Streptomyces sp. SID3343 TaxID=2690260 RepID=UPI0013696D67|nr:hypothetical protein [Streptomyces sp. SID3343]